MFAFIFEIVKAEVEVDLIATTDLEEVLGPCYLVILKRRCCIIENKPNEILKL